MLAAAELGHACAAQQLLLIDAEEALNVGAADTDESPLHQAALWGHAALFKQLLAAAPAAAVANTLHHTAAEGGDYDAWTVMHSAAVGGSAEALQALLELAPGAAAWTTEFGHTPLHEACY